MEEYEKLVKTIDLGPMWTEEEIEVFLKNFRRSGLKEVQQMQDNLKHIGYYRSIPNLLSIYKKNKNFLNANQNCSAHDLYLILADHYEQEQIDTGTRYQQPVTSKKRRINPVVVTCDPRKNVTPCYFPIDVQVDNLSQTISLSTCVNRSTIVLNNVHLGQKYCKWIRHEHFYSHLDYTYFNFNEFQALLQKANITQTQFTLAQWKRIKKVQKHNILQSIGKPRRFSQYYIQQEQQKLTKYRSIVRNYLFDTNYQIQNHIKNVQLLETLSKLAPYNVGQVVTAIHPVCGHLHQGTILSTNLPNIIVRFSHSELGVHKINDSNIALEEQFSNNQVLANRLDLGSNFYQNGSENRSFQISQIVTDLDCWAMALLIKILQGKQALVRYFQLLNQKIEDDPGALTDEFINTYAWTGIQINLFDQARKHTINKFRLRGAASYQLEQINDNLDKLLSVPLAYMERELEQNTEQDNDKARLQLKQIITKMQDDKISRDLQQIVQTQLLDKIDDENKITFEPLISSLMGILLTLNSTGDINLTDNQYMKQLAKIVYTQDSQQFCEINDTIIRIVNK